MANDLNLGSVGLSTAQAERAALSLAAKLRAMNADILQTTEVIYKFNAAGKLQGATFEVLTKQGDLAAASLAKTAKGWKVQVDSITSTIPKLNDMIKGWQNLAKALDVASNAQEKLNKKQLDRGFGALGKVAQQSELNDFNEAKKADAQIAKNLAKGLAALGKIAQAKELADFRDAQRQDALQARQLQKALNNLAKVGAAQEKLNQQAGRDRSQGIASDRLRTILPLNAGVAAADAAKFDGAIVKLTGSIARGKLTMTEFFTTVRAVMTGTTNTLTVTQQRYAAQVAAILAQRNKLNNALANQAQGTALQGQLQTAFPVNNIRATVGEINRLQGAIARASQLISSGKVTLTQFNSVLTTIRANGTATFTGIQQTAANAIRSIIAAQQNLGAQSQQTTQGILLSWQSFGRLLSVQIAHQIVSSITNAFKEGVKEAANFQVKISEIRTLAQENQRTFGAWSDSVRRLSDQFGSNIIDVAAGAYETLSNQIVKNTQEFEIFSREAQKFSIATVSTTKASVDLLSSALNSFGIATEETNRVAAVFFKTIDLGRVRADEMSETFGRMGPLANAVGISFEEVNAAISTLTNRGTRFNDAATIMNNLIVNLLKPSEEMTALLNDLGVASGEAAIATFGFTGFLNRMQAEAAKGSSRLAQLSPDMRALRAAIALSGEGFLDFTAALKENEHAVDDYENAVKIGMESAGKKLQIEVNKIKNFFVADLGAETLNTVQSFSDSVGVKLGDAVIGLASFTGKAAAVTGSFALVLVTLNVAVNSVRAGLVRYVAQMALTGQSTVVLTGLTASLGRVLIAHPVVALIAAAAGAIAYLATSTATANAKIKAAVGDYKAEVAQVDQVLTDEFLKQINQRFQDFKGGLDKQFKAFAQYVAAINSANTKLTERLNTQLELSQEAFKTIYNLAINTVKKQLEEVEGRVRAAQNSLKEAQANFVDIKNSFDEKTFQQNLNFATPDDQLLLIEQRIKDLDVKFKQLDAAGNFPEARKALEDMQELLFSLGDRAGDAFKKGATEVERLKKIIKDEQKDIADAQFRQNNGAGQSSFNNQTKTIAESNAIIAESQAKIAIVEQALVALGGEFANQKQRQKILNQDQLDFEIKAEQAARGRLAVEEAKLKQLEEQKRLATEAFSDLEAFNKKVEGQAFAGAGGKVDALKEFDAIKAQLLQATAGADPAQRLAIILRLEEQRQVIAKKIDADITANQLVELQRRTAAAKEALENVAGDAKAAVIENQQTVTTALTAAGGLTKELVAAAEAAGSTSAAMAKNFTPQLIKALETAKQIPTEANFEKIDSIVRQLVKFNGDASQITGIIKAIADARRAANELGGNKTALEDAVQAAKDLGLELNNALPAAYKVEETAAEQAGTTSQQSFNGVRKEVQSLIKDLAELQKGFNNLRPPQGGTTLPRFETGGLVMGPGGRDNVLARLTKNEFVMNERATRAHFPTLVAMNSGGRRGFSNGGPVNNTVGDINITVNGGSSSEATVRNIGKGLKREFRRNNLRPFNN